MRTYIRVAAPPAMELSLDLTGISVQTIAASLLEVMERSGMLEDSVSVATRKRNVTIEDQIRRLRSSLKIASSVYFNQLLSENTTWNEISVTLLAILELIKRHEVNVSQPELFGQIEIIQLAEKLDISDA